MPLQVAIIGGGIGGLAAAASLAKNGHVVTVYERSKSTTDVGFAFRITPNSDRCLRHLGIDTVEGGAVAVKAIRAFDKDGNVLFERSENVKKDAKPGQGTSVFAFRPQLTQQLLDVAVKHGVTVKAGVKVLKVDTSKTQLTFENIDNEPTTITADLIIAADGLNSIIRPFIVDSTKHHPTPSSHHNCLRFMIPADAIHNDPILSPVINETYNLASWTSHGKRVLAYPVDYGKQYNLVCTHPEDLSETAMLENSTIDNGDDNGHNQPQSTTKDDNANDLNDEKQHNDTTYDNKITLAQSLQIYADTDPTRISRLFHLADPSGFRIWKLQDLDELPTWHHGRVLLLGDAAHAVLPFGFSGASMAIEDAVVLGEMFGRIGSGNGNGDGDVDEVEEILRRFEEVRKPRVGRVREMSRLIGGGEEDKKTLGGYMEWLGDYDAVDIGRGARTGS